MASYIAFSVGEESFAMDVSQVREVCQFQGAVRVPQAPPHLLGLVSLRGRAIPVMDLGLRLGMGPIGSESREIIVVEVRDEEEGDWLMGMLVGAILGLDEVEDQEILPTPSLAPGVGRFVAGIFRQSGYYLLEPSRLCASQ